MSLSSKVILSFLAGTFSAMLAWVVIDFNGFYRMSSHVSGESFLDIYTQQAFIGAVLVQFGAGIAGGCTSGLAISGGAVLAPGAFIFMAGMFLGGIPTALLWYRGRP